MDKNRFIGEFGLKPFGQKGWMKGALHCPECNRNDKFGVLLTEANAVCHCFHCGVSFGVWQILKNIGRLDLLDFVYTGEFLNHSLSKREEPPLPRELNSIIGFQRLESDNYLEGRGFVSSQYEQFAVGESLIDPRVEGMVVFKIFQNKKEVGWMARSRKSKEWHKENIAKYKAGEDSLHLRYCNSNSDFSKMLGGLDELTDKTRLVFMVEGLMDKANMDRLLSLNCNDVIKCLFSFGDDLSNDQVSLIPDTVEEVYLLYDSNTMRNMKAAGARMMCRFKVWVCSLTEPGIDPGNIDWGSLVSLLENSVEFLEYYNKIENKKLW